MKKILAIDDDQAVLNYLNIMLLQTGSYEVATLANSSKAYHELKSNDYDLLLLDMDMPEVNGLDILKYIKEKNIDIEIIVLTGVEDVELAVSAMKLGAFDYLTKPVDNDQLLKIITTVLESRKARVGLPERHQGHAEGVVRGGKPWLDPHRLFEQRPRFLGVPQVIEHIAEAVERFRKIRLQLQRAPQVRQAF